MRLPQEFNDDKSILVQVMAWRHQAPSWPRFMWPLGITGMFDSEFLFWKTTRAKSCKFCSGTNGNQAIRCHINALIIFLIWSNNFICVLLMRSNVQTENPTCINPCTTAWFLWSSYFFSAWGVSLFTKASPFSWGSTGIKTRMLPGTPVAVPGGSSSRICWQRKYAAFQWSSRISDTLTHGYTMLQLQATCVYKKQSWELGRKMN